MPYLPHTHRPEAGTAGRQADMHRTQLVGGGAGGGLLGRMEGHLCVVVDGLVGVAEKAQRGGGGMGLLVAGGEGGTVVLAGAGE